MKKVFLMVMFTVFILPFALSASDHADRILIINSYHRGYPWSDDEIKGAEDEFRNKDGDFEIYIENMDTKRYGAEEKKQLEKLFLTRLIEKTKNKNIKGIITFDDDALRFLVKYRRKLNFDKVPVVSCGVNLYPESLLKHHEDIVVALESGEHKGTIDFALRLEPKAEKVYVITGRSYNGLLHKEKIKRLAKEYEGKIDFEFLDTDKGITFEELIEKVKKIPAGQIVYHRGFFLDRDGNPVEAEKSIKEVCENSMSPVYNPDEIYLGLGVVGGKMKSGIEHGKYAANMLHKMINNIKIAEEEKVVTLSNVYMADEKVLKKYGLKKERLPKETSIINHIDNVFTKYWKLILAVLIIMIIEAFIITSLFISIRQKRRAEHMIKKYLREIELRNEDLRYFAYAASHDMKEPLRQISGYVSIIEKKLKDKLEEEDKECMDYIKTGVYTLESMLKDILNYSVIDAKDGEVSEFNVSVLIDRVCGNLESNIKENNAKIIKDFDTSLTIKWHEEQMMSIFQNLISNALKFTKVSPEIRIKCRSEKEMYEFCVTDNGIGFDAKYKERIFALFEKLHSKAEYSGNGMGLAICRKIVERYGGKMWAKSSEGKGASFCFTVNRK